MIEKSAKNIPKTVERYVQEHLDQGMEESKAWAIAWSRFCKYKYPNSDRCKQDDYFQGRKSNRNELVAKVTLRYLHEQGEQ